MEKRGAGEFWTQFFSLPGPKPNSLTTVCLVWLPGPKPSSVPEEMVVNLPRKMGEGGVNGHKAMLHPRTLNDQYP